MGAKVQTYKEKKSELLAYLEGEGWKVQRKKERAPFDDLKVPRATSPDGSIVLAFRSQSIYKGEHSLVSDSKSVTGEELIRLAKL